MSSPRSSSSSALLLLALITIGCGSLRPLVDVEAETRSQPPGVTLSVSEGRPTSVVLSIHWEQPLDFTRLELVRADSVNDPTILHTIEASPQILTQLKKGVLISDPTIPHATVVYAIIAYEGEKRVSWDEIVFDWTAPLSPTTVGFEVVGGAVDLRWLEEQEQGAVIFRRDVISGDGLERVAEIEPSSDGTYLDTGVQPDGVYAYRVALMERIAYQNKPGFLKRFGIPSEEVYVTLSQIEEDSSPANEPVDDSL